MDLYIASHGSHKNFEPNYRFLSLKNISVSIKGAVNSRRSQHRSHMVCMAARQGRELQRYNSHGGRQVAGCIPYRFKSCDGAVEVLVVSSQKGNAMLFPKGGWESDETVDQAASREALEEAGVQGKLEDKLGSWEYKSKRYGTIYEGIMFALSVTEELTYWPEMSSRNRKWVTIAEAREGCRDSWMRDALEVLVSRLQQEKKMKAIQRV